MKKLLLFFIAVLPILSFSQNLNPVKWEVKFTELSNNEGEIVLTAKIDKGWHVYSQNISPDAGPIPTSFNYSPGSNFELVGKTLETNAKEIHDKAFDTKMLIFEEKAVFKQKMKLKNTKGFNSPIKLEFMTCNDLQCLPPKTVDLQLIVPAKK